MRRLLLLCLTCFVIFSKASGQAPDKAAMDTFLNRLAQYQKVMGYIELSKGGKVIYSKGMGEARPGVPNTAATVFRIGSISKMITATMVMQQIEDGKLRRDDKLAKWFPELPNAADISIDQLLSHTSGLHSITNDSLFMSWQDTVSSQASVIRRMAAQPADLKPGEKFAYSNTNFILLGYILERVSGMPYEKLLKERIAKPLKLKTPGLGPRKLPAKGKDAASFSFGNGKWTEDTLSNATLAGGSGGIVCSVPEMGIFMEALMRGRVLADSSLALMQDIRGGYGRGMARFPYYERSAFGHNGQIDNFSSMLAFFPQDSLVVSFVCNGVNYKTNDLLLGILNLYFGKPFTMPDYSRAAALTAEQLQRMEGIYVNSEIGMEISVKVSGQKLIVHPTNQRALDFEPISPLVFENSGVGATVEFSEGPAPASSLTLVQAGTTLKFSRKP